MKKQLATMMTLAAAMTLFSATASAQSVGKKRSTDRLDFNPVVQVVGSTVGAGLVGGGGVVTGGVLGFLACGGSLFSGACSTTIGGGMLFGGAAGVIGGAVLGAGILGGDYGTSRDYGVSAAGGALGLLLAVPTTLVIDNAMRGASIDQDAIFWTNVATMSLMTGLGASLAYQATYSVPWMREVSLTPMVTGEHNGLVLSGRF